MRTKTHLLGCRAIVQAIAMGFNYASAQPAAVANDPTQSNVSNASGIEDVIVSASRRDETMSQVPISMTVATPASLAEKGIKDLSDLSRMVPGVTFTPGINGSTNLSVRGISSIVGAATTGIYIDDTPIQSRFVGAAQSSTNPYPIPFDTARIEVLRGPQGTLFGAGSEGGTVRFISPTPSLNQFDLHAESLLGSTQNGAPSFGVGIAGGGPIIAGVLGVRLTAYARQDGGWIDRVTYPSMAVTAKDANRQNNVLLRGSALWQVTPQLTIAPSVTYQQITRDDDPGYSRYNSSPADGQFNDVLPLAQPWSDRHLLSTVNVDYDFNGFRVINVASWFDRHQANHADYSAIAGELLGQNFEKTLLLGTRSPAEMYNSQKSITEELRVQSSDEPSDRLKWVGGFFYQSSKQVANQYVHLPNIDQVSQSLFGAPATLIFGSGNLEPGDINYEGLDNTRDEQIAGFGQVDFEILPKLTLTAGARIAQFNFNYTNHQDGPYNGGPTGSNGNATSTAFTPKAVVKYSPSDNLMFYGSASKGVRQGGANTPVSPARCSADLSALGIGNPPGQYKPDSVWSYEVGAKGSLADGVVQFDGSLYDVNWEGIQNIVYLNNCGFNFIDNLGEAVSRGFDLNTSVQAGEKLRFDVAVGYTDAHYSETVLGAPTASGSRGVIVANGNNLSVAPWRVTIGADYLLPSELGGFKPYSHFNYSYSSPYQDGTGPGTLTYDPIKGRRDPIDLFNGRFGFRGDTIDAAFYVDNILNVHPVVGVARTTVVTQLVRDYTIQPRTIGLTVNYNY